MENKIKSKIIENYNGEKMTEFSKKMNTPYHITRKILVEGNKLTTSNDRKKRIIENYNGETISAYSKKIGFSYGTTKKYLEMGVKEGLIKEVNYKKSRVTKHTEEIIEFYKKNYPKKTLSEIGIKFGVSRQRVDQIVKKYNARKTMV